MAAKPRVSVDLHSRKVTPIGYTGCQITQEDSDD